VTDSKTDSRDDFPAQRSRQSSERVRDASAADRLEQYRLRFLGGGNARPPKAMKDIKLDASGAPDAIRRAFDFAWPPSAVELLLLDHKGRVVFGRVKGSSER